MLAVSISVPPAPTNASSWDAAASASLSRPQVIVPRPSLDTSRPLRPTRHEAMTANLAGGRRLTRVRGGTRYRDLGVAPALRRHEVSRPEPNGVLRRDASPCPSLRGVKSHDIRGDQ